MKWCAVLLSGFLALAAGASDKTQLAGIRTVYFLPMGNGFDQYLANRITNLGLFQVVTDPKKADAVFTDHLGRTFESRLDELFPQAPPKPVAAKPDNKSKEAKEGKEAEKAESGDQIPEEGPAPYFSSFGRGKGTLFLVDTRTRNVVWSTYDKPKDATAPELDRTSAEVADRLKRALKSK